MKAIVLTFDKYRCFTDHMIRRYEEQWPDHPFIFYIPYQELGAAEQSDKVSYIKSSPRIKDTVKALLHELDDEEWIYWCIDDKYPISIEVERIKKIHEHILSNSQGDIDGLLFCRCRSMLRRRSLTGKSLKSNDGETFLERQDYSQIWIHQYLKAKVLKHLFDAFPDRITSAKAMDALKKQITKPANHRLFVTRENLATFGESTSRGKITTNCLESMHTLGMTPPPWTIDLAEQKRIIMGEQKRDVLRHILKSKMSNFLGRRSHTASSSEPD